MNAIILRLHLTFFLLVFTSGINYAIASEALPEDAIKAGYLYHFGILTNWPSEIDNTTINFCVYGNSNIKKELSDLTQKNNKAQKYRVYNIDYPAPPPECHMLFLSGSNSFTSEKLIQSYAERPTLTVTDKEELSKQGTAIFIRPEGKRLAFEINHRVAQNANLVISSKLLRLSR